MKSLVSITRKLVGRGYILGTNDCFSLILNYLSMNGVTVPDNYEGISRDTYADLFTNDPGKAKKLMVSFLDNLLETVPSAEAFAGDILLLVVPGELPFLAINAGNGRVIGAAPSKGVCQLPANKYEIVRVWRCQR